MQKSYYFYILHILKESVAFDNLTIFPLNAEVGVAMTLGEDYHRYRNALYYIRVKIIK